MSDTAAPAAGRRTAELAVAAGTALFGAVIVAGSLEQNIGWSADGPGAGYFPFYIGLLIVGSSLGTFLHQLLRARTTGASFVTRDGLRRVVEIFIPTVLCAATMPWLGLYVPSALYVAVIMRRQGGYGWPFAMTIGAAAMVASFAIFELWFQVPLAKGPLEALLGLD